MIKCCTVRTYDPIQTPLSNTSDKNTPALQQQPGAWEPSKCKADSKVILAPRRLSCNGPPLRWMVALRPPRNKVHARGVLPTDRRLDGSRFAGC